jgi:hypothetical protein
MCTISAPFLSVPRRHGCPAQRPSWSPWRALAITAFLTGCGPTVYHPTLHSAGEVPSAAEEPAFLKAHLRSGELILFETWDTSLIQDSLVGFGSRYQADRTLVGARGRQTVHVDSIALLEANRKDTVSEFALFGLSAWTTLAGAVSALCVADPKSCFGSCPTFYLPSDPEGAPVAEGFSASFARVLEERDLDALGVALRGGDDFTLHMRNEAWETHAVRRIRIHAVPVPEGASVLQTVDGALFEATRVDRAFACTSVSGDCTRQVSIRDQDELRIWADSLDLARRTEVFLTFPPTQGASGVVLSARHSFVSTFVFYQGLAYAGRNTGELMASVERGDRAVLQRVLGPARELGPVQIDVAEGPGAWRRIGEFSEAGPIATDRIVLPFEADGGGPLRVRLRMAQGSWRVDEVALATLARRLDPVVIEPTSVVRRGQSDPAALGRLNDAAEYLVTTPGDHYELGFRLPVDTSAYELFLESEGYYYEWMREAWLVEEDPALAFLLMTNPREGLRVMAPAFKAVESGMEASFWASRFRR